MRNRVDGTPGAPGLPNAFSPDFLRRLEESDYEPPTAAEAEVAGGCSVRRLADGRFGVFVSGDAVPVAAFRSRARAFVAAGMLPGTGRDPAYVLRKEADPDGYALLAGLDGEGLPEVEGHMRRFDQSLAEALHNGDGVVRAPESLAYLMAAAGKAALVRAGALLELLLAEIEGDPE